MPIRLYREEFYPSDEMEVCQENLDDFFKFIHERHQIWRRRFILNLPREQWTNNPILKQYKYTNVYRELDRGTLWYLKNIAEPWLASYYEMHGITDKVRNKDFSGLKHLIWKTTIYRLCNRIETFEEVGFPTIKDYDTTKLHNDFWSKLNVISERGDPVFTSAHLTCPTPTGYTKIEGYIAAIIDLHQKLDGITKDIQAAKTSKEVFDILTEVHCVGNFIGYEVLCDLMYTRSIGCNDKPFTEDDWANVGPGANEGIRLIYPSAKGKKAIYERMVQLRDEQHKHFERLGIKFDFYEKFTQGHLSLRSLEHSLCEMSKFWLQKHRLGKQRMIFSPNTHNTNIINGNELKNKQ